MLIFMGMGLFLWTKDNSCPYGIMSLDWILWGNPFLEPSHVIFIGLLILIVTPLIRVFASIIAYIIDRDWTYVIITSTVLVILITGMILGVG
jgi:uncharacterized membrane protein